MTLWIAVLGAGALAYGLKLGGYLVPERILEVPWIDRVVPLLTVAQNIFLGRQPRRFGLVDARALRHRTRELVTRLGIDVDVDAPLGRLGLGVQQMVALARAVSDPGEARRRGEAGRARAVGSFSWETIAEATAGVYRAALAG